ncbi:MAG TPA: glycogen synthase [Chloroflexia bacterium]|nr:glycogen synthase [Chloroflexia bacterium]
MSESPTAGALKILLVAAEVAPFAKVGGLADVAGALPLALRALGHDVRVVMPQYTQVDAVQHALRPRVADLAVPLGETTQQVAILESTIGRAAEVPVYFVCNAHYYGRPEVYAYPDDDERFLLFCRAALEMLPALAWWPDVIHCNDWHTGIIPNWLQTIYRKDPRYARIATVYTIHNLAYQGVFPESVLARTGLQAYGRIAPEVAHFPGQINLMARGLLYADAITTVSQQYAREILTPEYGEQLDSLLRERQAQVFGIVNGIDVDLVDPRTDPHLAQPFDADHLEGKAANKAALQQEAGLPPRPDVPICGAISRLAAQKGFEIMVPMLEQLLTTHDVQFVVLAIGNPGYEAQFRQLQARFPNQVAAFLRFDAPLAQRIYGGADLFLMPSRFEPCGLGQMFAMRYGTVPVVRKTGGLADTVRDYDPATGAGDGFVFTRFSPDAFLEAAERALALYAAPAAWRKLVQHDMALDWSWDLSARQYVDLYRRVTNDRGRVLSFEF